MNSITICPRCSKRFRVSEQIADKSSICPHCLANVDNPRPGVQFRVPDINTDVKRDVSAGTVVLTVLLGLCLVGIVLAFSIRGESGITLLALSCIALAVVVHIAIILRAGSGTHRLSVERVLGTAFLVLGSTVAIFIFFFFGCASMIRLGPW